MKQYFTIVFMLLTVLSYTQTVHFAHGLDQSDNSWGPFSDKLKSNCSGLNTTTFQMSLTNGIDAYSNQFIENLENYGASKDDIAIGHSFGGVNLRNCQNAGLFGGYITVGSPHNGSKLANSTMNGDLEAWVTLGCKDVVADPIASLTPLFGFDPPAFLVDEGEYFMCEMVFGILMEQAENFVGTGLGVEEMILNGDIANLPPANIPAISILGSADYHVMWNMLQGAVTSGFPNTIYGKPFSVFAGFVQNNAMATSKLLSTISHLNRYNLFGWNYHQQLKKASREFLESYTWMRNSESVWNELIGAGGGVSWALSENETWACDCYNVNTGQPVSCNTLGSTDEITIYDVDSFSTCAADDDEDCWIDEITMIPIFGEDLESDGLLPIQSQSLPGSIYEEQVFHVSHFEEPFHTGVHNTILKNLHPDTAPHPVFSLQQCL